MAKRVVDTAVEARRAHQARIRDLKRAGDRRPELTAHREAVAEQARHEAEVD